MWILHLSYCVSTQPPFSGGIEYQSSGNLQNARTLNYTQSWVKLKAWILRLKLKFYSEQHSNISFKNVYAANNRKYEKYDQSYYKAKEMTLLSSTFPYGAFGDFLSIEPTFKKGLT